MARSKHSPAADSRPAISVVLPVYNGEPYLAEAIASLLEQTFADFELIAICDISTDNSRRCLEDAARRDPRVCVVDGPGRGLVAALNLGLAVARGEFIARMDADDVALPSRFAAQVSYLRAHPDIAVVGSMITLIDAAGATIRDIDYPKAPADVERFLVEIGCALAHPAVMARRDAMLSVGGYRDLFQHAEDYDLWLRMAERYALANLSERLLLYRQHDTKGSFRHATAQRLATHVARLCAKVRRAGQPDPLAGQLALLALSLADLDRFALGAEERAAILRDVESASASPAPVLSLPKRARRALVLALQRVLPPAWFARLRSLAGKQRSVSA